MFLKGCSNECPGADRKIVQMKVENVRVFMMMTSEMILVIMMIFWGGGENGDRGGAHPDEPDGDSGTGNGEGRTGGDESGIDGGW